MSFCINPHCPQPQNPYNEIFCLSCGSELLLQGRYWVMHRLGGGGFGVTFEINEVPSNTSKVLKVLINNQPKAVELFQQEARVLALLNHPGIPKVEQDGYFVYFPRNSKNPIHCLVMEKIVGIDLQKWMENRGMRPIDQTLALRWLQELVSILQEVHKQNFFHRDIKPPNIMLRANSGELALIDFGTVRQVTSTIVNRQGGVTGVVSAGYTPVEQINNNAVPQSDFFALGRTFVYLLTGKQPLEQEIYDFQNDELCWRPHAPQISESLANLLDEMMAHKPNQRPASTQLILQRLGEIAGAVSPAIPQPQPQPAPKPQSPTRRRFMQVAGLTGLGVATAAVIRESFKPQMNSANTGELAKSLPSSVTSRETIKVGILHSLSGTLAIAEKSLVDAEKLAIAEINAAGGVLGKQIEAVIEDGASDWPTFNVKASKLIDQDQVVVIFGCGNSASRKSILPILESKDHMLWYPVAYEGQECSRNIFYTGATPNQQIEPAVNWLFNNKGKEFFLVSSDYVFPRTANTIIKAQLQALGGKTVGEDYIPLGNTQVTPIINKIKQALPRGGIIFNTLNGDTNVAFFKQLQVVGLTPDKYPTLSVNITEEEVRAIGVKYLNNHYATWNYFQTIDTPENQKFVQAFKQTYGVNRLINDSMEAAYIAVYLWKQAVEKAGTTDIPQVRPSVYGQTINAPEGKVTMNVNHHLSKIVRIGRVRNDGLFDIVSTSSTAVAANPWSQWIRETKGFACDWSDPVKGGKYKQS